MDGGGGGGGGVVVHGEHIIFGVSSLNGFGDLLILAYNIVDMSSFHHLFLNEVFDEGSGGFCVSFALVFMAIN